MAAFPHKAWAQPDRNSKVAVADAPKAEEPKPDSVSVLTEIKNMLVYNLSPKSLTEE
jgi:hypothetical protein